MQKIISFFRLSPDYKNRVFGLDLMRALAILFVVMGHALMLEKADTNYPWIKLINGVELFFVLSGFLIGNILLKRALSPEPFGFSSMVYFWIRRWFRTLPAYYLVLLINIVFVYYGIIVEDISQFNWKFFFFLHNFSEPFGGFFWESWSLSVEEWFYFLFPMVMALQFYITGYGRLPNRYVYLSSVCMFLITPFLLRYFVASNFEVDFDLLNRKIYKVVIFRLDGIALGLLAAYIKYFYEIQWHKSRNILFILGLTINYILLYSDWPSNDFNTKVYKIFIQSIACAMLLPKFDSIKDGPKTLVKIVTHISLISYAMYLINLALVAEVIRDNVTINTPLQAWSMYIVFWIAVILLSTVIYKYFEKPMTDLRDKIRWKDI